MKRKRKKRRRSRVLCWLEYSAACCAIRIAQILPLRWGYWLARVGGALVYYLVPRRRKIALGNLRHVFGGKKSDPEIRRLARQSCYSFIASMFELGKFVAFLSGAHSREISEGKAKFDPLFQKAREIHEAAGGCIFVTPHLGNWELLPYASLDAGIPLVIVVRPLDNRYLERLFYSYRGASGQIIVPKKNSLYLLQAALRRGKSIALLPDQSTMKAITVDYMGKEATTTPVPAFLAVLYHRPIVVVACCRIGKGFCYEGFVSEPIWPVAGANEKNEIFRLTRTMNDEMEKVIYQYPEQYLWMHDRWKRYRTKGALSLTEGAEENL